MAEDGEGASEAHFGEEAKDILPCSDMVDFADETSDRWWRGGVGRVGRFGKRRKVISRKGGDFCSMGRGISMSQPVEKLRLMGADR